METVLEPGFPIPLNICGFSKDYKKMDYWLQRFILEIRRKNGNYYPPNTLLQISSVLQHYLKTECDVNDVNFFKEDDPTFAGFRKTLDARMKELTSQGLGVKTERSDPVTKEDEGKLWASGVFSSNAVFFYNGKTFRLRGYQEHVNCQSEQSEIGYDVQNGQKFVKFTQRIRKNAQGGPKHKKINTEPIVHY